MTVTEVSDKIPYRYESKMVSVHIDTYRSGRNDRRQRREFQKLIYIYTKIILAFVSYLCENIDV